MLLLNACQSLHVLLSHALLAHQCECLCFSDTVAFLVFDGEARNSVLGFKEGFWTVLFYFGLGIRDGGRTVWVFAEHRSLDGSFFKNILNLPVRSESFLSIWVPGGNLQCLIIALNQLLNLLNAHSNDSINTDFNNGFEFDPKCSDCTNLEERLLKIAEGELGMFLQNGGDLAWVNFLLLLELVFGQFEFRTWLCAVASVSFQVKDQGVLTCADATEHELEVLIEFVGGRIFVVILDHYKRTLSNDFKLSTFKLFIKSRVIKDWIH